MSETTPPSEEFQRLESGESVCFFCGSEDILVPGVGISLGMAGWDYNFCQPCLSARTAEQFWVEVFLAHEYAWPPQKRD